MSELGWQLAAAIKSFSSRTDQIVLSEEITYFRHVNHVSVMQTVIVTFILVEDSVSEICEIELGHICVLVITDKKFDGVKVFTPDGTRDDGSVLE